VTGPPERRFADALAKAREEWAAADAATCAARAGCTLTDGGVLVPLFGRPHLVAHPGGEVTAAKAGREPGQPAQPPAPGEPAHIAVAILLLHYLLLADGAPPAGAWSAYRELPDGLFYAASFADRAEAPLTRAFAGSRSSLDAFRAAARAAGGDALTLGDASFRFVALPRVDIAVLVWAGDGEEPGEARVLFDANAGHYLPAEDLAGLGGQLAHRLAAAARA
jgi:Domain of unknown function (DUF3786)